MLRRTGGKTEDCSGPARQSNEQTPEKALCNNIPHLPLLPKNKPCNWSMLDGAQIEPRDQNGTKRKTSTNLRMEVKYQEGQRKMPRHLSPKNHSNKTTTNLLVKANACTTTTYMWSSWFFYSTSQTLCVGIPWVFWQQHLELTQNKKNLPNLIKKTPTHKPASEHNASTSFGPLPNNVE